MIDRRFALYFMTCFTALFLCFAPVVWIESVFHDNVRYFAVPADSPAKASCQSDSQFQWLNFIDRPVTAVIECIVTEHADTPGDLSVMRVFVIGLMAVAAAFLAMVLFEAGLSDITALATSLAVFSLPGDVNTALMTNFPNAVTLSTALGAFMLMSQIRHASPWNWQAGDMVKAALAWCLLIVDGLTYPALAMVFLWGSVIRTLTDESRPARQESAMLVRDVGMFGSAMFCALLGAHFLVPSSWKVPPGAGVPSAYELGFSLAQLSAALQAMMRAGLPKIFSLWFFNCGWQGTIPALLLCALAAGTVVWGCRLEQLRVLRVRLLFVIGVFLISLAPVFLPKSPALFERVLLPAMGVLLLTLVLILATALRRQTAILPVMPAVVLACLGLFASSFEAAKMVWNVNMETMFARIELAQRPEWPRSIHVILPVVNGFGYDGLRGEADEFNVPTVGFPDNLSNFMKVVAAGLPNARPMAVCDPAMFNCIAGLPDDTVILTVSDYGKPFCRLPDMALIDFNVLLAAAGVAEPARPQLSEIPYCPTSLFSVNAPPPSTPGHAVNRAFWPSTTADDFWETRLDQPVAVLLTFTSPTKISSYRFKSGAFAGRMPLSWSVSGSVDGQTWTVLDERKDQRLWSAFEQRTFVLKELPTSIKYLRFVFSDAGPSKILRLYGIHIN